MQWHQYVVRYAFIMGLLVLAVSVAPSWLKPALITMIVIYIIGPFINPHRVWRRLAASCTAFLLIRQAGAVFDFNLSFLKLEENSTSQAAVSFVWDDALGNIYVIVALIIIFIIADFLQNVPDWKDKLKGSEIVVKAIDERTRIIRNSKGEMDVIVICRVENNSGRIAPVDAASLHIFFGKYFNKYPRREINNGIFINEEYPIPIDKSVRMRLDFFDIYTPLLMFSVYMPECITDIFGLDTWSGTIILKVANQEKKFRVTGKISS